MHERKNKAFFLDRDGVLNRPIVKEGKPYPPQALSEFEIYPDVYKALTALKAAGFLLIVVTNQPDVLRGMQKQETVESMHDLLMEKLPLDDIEVCYDETSNRYKPGPGMLLDSAQKHNIELISSYMVGDRWRDIGAGHASGCYTIFIDHNYTEALREKPDLTCSSLKEAAKIILSGTLC